MAQWDTISEWIQQSSTSFIIFQQQTDQAFDVEANQRLPFSWFYLVVARSETKEPSL